MFENRVEVLLGVSTMVLVGVRISSCVCEWWVMVLSGRRGRREWRE